MTYRDFVKDLNNDMLGDMVVFTGAEDYLMNRAAEQLIDRFIDPSSRNIDLIYPEGDRITAAEILCEARNYSMLSDRRVIIIKNYLPMYRQSNDPELDLLIEAAAHSAGTSVIVFMLESRHTGDITAFGRRLIKACRGYDFGRLEKNELKDFITKRIRSEGKLIGKRELEHLIDISGYYNKDSTYDLTMLEGDIFKITKACETDSISSGTIEELLIGDDDKFVFDLIDALVKGNRSRSLEIAEAIIREGGGALPVISLLIKQFEIMYDALELSREGRSLGQMVHITGINEYRFKKAYQAAGAYGLSRLGYLLKALYNIDRDMKRGDIDRDIALELFTVTASPVR